MRGWLIIAVMAVASSASAGRIPVNTIPYLEPDHWPLALETEHFVVHYQASGDLGVAQLVADDVEYAWADYEALGAPAPLGNAWSGDPDPRLDVYLWRGIDTMYVEELVEAEPVTDPDIDDAATYIVLDPWGQYGLGVSETELKANIYHELRHAIQGVHDWWEDYWVFEAEATFWEARSAFGFARLGFAWADVQAHADWGPFRVDGYRTWTMYGGALYFDFLSHAYFGGGMGFTNAMWAASENPPGAEFDPALNEPDFADALDDLLADEGSSVVGSVVAFARARWYTGSRADATLFTAPSVIPEVPVKLHARGGGSPKSTVKVDAMVLGTAYVTVERGAADPVEIFVSLKAGGPPVAVQTVGRGAADQLLALSGGARARIRFGTDRKAHLAVTFLPQGAYDPDAQSDYRWAATLQFER
jgi:hypothetical protein